MACSNPERAVAMDLHVPVSEYKGDTKAANVESPKNKEEYNKFGSTTKEMKFGSKLDTKFTGDPNSTPRRQSFTYEKPCEGDQALKDLPLSMRFMHKPSRAKELLEKASDPTRANSISNSHMRNLDVVINDELITSLDDVPDTTTSPLETLESSPLENSPLETSHDSENYRLVRKKSGEILKPSLKDSSLASYFSKIKRSRSLPTTPTYKQVHFGFDNDVRYFKTKDKPNTISATNSPTLAGTDVLLEGIHLDSDDEDDEDDANSYSGGSHPSHSSYSGFEDDEEFNNFNLNSSGSSSYPRNDNEIEWKLRLLNFAPLSYTKNIEKSSPVFLERLFITIDKKYLLGHIAVKNLSFEKYLTVRYSLDNWLTIIEIPTSFIEDRPDILKQNNYDRFIFQIPLHKLFNSFGLSSAGNHSSGNAKSKNTYKNVHVHNNSQENIYQLCIKYYANGREYWDNNNFKNYEIGLTKTSKNMNPNPKGSNSKVINNHNKKPKYSSSYLKRRTSDSQLQVSNTKKQELEDEMPVKTDSTSFYLQDNSSSDINDFVKNNYYMSSPLLSSLNSTTKATPTFSKFDNFLHDKAIEPPSPIPNYRKKFGQDNVSKLDTSNFNDTKRSPSPTKNPVLTSKSYKDLLDNYCFFSSSSHMDEDEMDPIKTDFSKKSGKSATSSDKSTKSPTSTTSTAETSNLSSKSKKPFAVSTFLDNFS